MAPLPAPRGFCPAPLSAVGAPKNQRALVSLHALGASSCRGQAAASTHKADTTDSDVYLTAREFKCWGGPAFKQLPRSIKEFILDIGVCHYLVLVKAPDGSVRQFDFGPCGGDVHLAIPGSNLRRAASLSLCAAMHTEPLVLEDSMSLDASQHSDRGVLGEVREDLLPDLPSHAPVVHIGRTALSVQDIRDFNARQPRYYLLHENDCRHYTNNLVQYMTGMQKGTSVFLHQQYVEKVSSCPLRHPHRPLIHAMQAVTDVTNWESMRCVASLAAAAVTSLWGVRLWGGFRLAPSRVAAGLASRVLSRLVKPRAGLVLTAAASRPQGLPVLSPAAVGAASLTASKVGGRHLGFRNQPWKQPQGDAAMSGVDLSSLVTARQAQQPDAEETRFAKIGRVSRSVGAALASYASTPAPLHLVHILKQQVSAVRRMRSNPPAALTGSRRALGAGAGKAHSLALVKAEGPGTLMVRSPDGAATHLHDPFPQAAAVWGQLAAPGSQDASDAQGFSSSTPTAAALPKTPSRLSHARFFTRGSKTLFLGSRSKGGPAAGGSPHTQQQKQCGRDATITAFSAALQPQAARWYL